VRRYGNVDYAVTFDSDGQHKIEDLEKFVTALNANKELDLAIGSRFLK